MIGIWPVASVSETPHVALVQWFIAETDKGEKHFVGYNVTDGEGRVSSAIREFDKTTMVGITRSGRLYKLVNESGYNADALHVWHLWRAFNKVESWSDVTEDVLNLNIERPCSS